MSLILEALKKSDRQRSQHENEPPGVRKRILSLGRDRQSSHRLVFFGLALTFVVCAALYVALTSTLFETTTTSVSLELDRSAKNSELLTREPSIPLDVPPDRPVTFAPVPQPVSPAPILKETAVLSTLSASRPTESHQSDVPSQARPNVENAQVKVETVSQPLAKEEAGFPSYNDLTGGLREGLPRLNMSMHFYVDAPERRLVRIDDLLLHEGDWINDQLQVVEIRPTGAVLDYQGMKFELRTQRK